MDAKTSNNTIISLLVYRPMEKYRFMFNNSLGSWGSRFSPGKDVLEAAEYATSFDDQLEACATWVSYLKREISTPEWDSLFRVGASQARTALSATENTPFTEIEIRSISERLSKIEADLLSQGKLSQAQSDYVKSELRKLAESASRFGRKDWVTFAMGTAVSISLYLAQPETGSWLLKGLTTLWTSLHGSPALPM